MKRNQTSITNGIQNILFPMETLFITQGDNEGTHRGTFAIDNAGKNIGIEPWYAPFDMKLVAYDSARNGNAVFFESTHKVRLANGAVDYVTMMVIHDNYIKDIINLANQGYIFRQGEEVGDEGTAGRATGNHCHIEFARGKFHHMYDQNKYGVYHLPNNMPIEDVCFMDGTIMKCGVADWKYTKSIKVSSFKEKGTVTALYDGIRVRTTPSTKKGYTGSHYNKGMKLWYDSLVHADGFIWAKYKASNGQTHYVALESEDGKEKYWK